MPIALAPHIHLAIVDDDLVFLDAASDQYLCVSRHHTAEILAALTGQADTASDVVQSLVCEGLLVRQSRATPCWPGSIAETAQADLGTDAAAPRLRIRDVGALMLAVWRTWRDLAKGTPDIWFADQRRWRASARPTSGAHIVELARRLAWLRVLVPRSGRCLVGSLLLLHFLRLHDVTATWMFAVRTHPFEAHCWVEQDGIVLNDTLEHVHWYTPIVAV